MRDILCDGLMQWRIWLNFRLEGPTFIFKYSINLTKSRAQSAQELDGKSEPRSSVREEVCERGSVSPAPLKPLV